MDKPLTAKIERAILFIRNIWPRIRYRNPFIAFSAGKDSLAMTALISEALESQSMPILYSSHDFEFPGHLEYINSLSSYGIITTIVHPFLNYFELVERGIGFNTLHDAWCVPYLVGSAFHAWAQEQKFSHSRQLVMFRGMTGSEHHHYMHRPFEIYGKLGLPTINPMLDFTKSEILQIINQRYGLPLNPIYQYMDRTYCICCYTQDAKRQAYSIERYPELCKNFYDHVERLLFSSGLIEKAKIAIMYKTREEKIGRHGFVHWQRMELQNIPTVLKKKYNENSVGYFFRDADLIDPKHLIPLNVKKVIGSNSIFFPKVDIRKSDVVIKRMINCLDCGFCVSQCYKARRFDANSRAIAIEECNRCGRCISLTYCMGWKHRFWRRTIVEGKENSFENGLKPASSI
jgi:3'-phosphoadenosine 5'-phosphosulfate sulfotransferase (PAPS reductase)/FAD synthetase